MFLRLLFSCKLQFFLILMLWVCFCNVLIYRFLLLNFLFVLNVENFFVGAGGGKWGKVYIFTLKLIRLFTLHGTFDR